MQGMCGTCQHPFLDRAIVNSKWYEGSQWHLISLPRKHSDHRPLILFIRIVNWGSKPFKAFNVWIKNERLMRLINEGVNFSNNEPLWITLKRVKRVIKSWNLNKNGDINKKIKDKEEDLEKLDNEDINAQTKS